MADSVAIGLRAVASAAALLAAGGPIFLALFGALLDRSTQRIRAAATAIVIAALILTLLHLLIEPVRLAGDWSGILDRSMHAILLGSSFGAAIGIRLLGLLLILIAGRKPRQSATRLGIAGTALVVVSFALTGHTAADPQRWLLAPLLLAHLLALTFWFGALLPLVSVTRCEDAALAGAIVERFSRVAVRIVPWILVAGVAMATLLLPDLASLGTPYGTLLLVKAGGFSGLMLLAALNKWRFGPRIALHDESATMAFQRVVAAECLVIFLVIAITVAMTALYSPGH